MSSSSAHDTSTTRSGALYALAAYTAWGLFPIFWKLLKEFPAVELIAHRLVWAGLFYWVLSIYFGSKANGWLSLLRDRMTAMRIVVAGTLLTTNWLIYVWAVNSGHVVEASLGYFITPLFNVLMGAWILKEHLSRSMKLSFALATAGVLLLAFQSERFPWISLALAVSFSTYGFIRKKLHANIYEASTAETAVFLIPALSFVIFSRVSPEAVPAGPWEYFLFIISGTITGLPLIWFVQAAKRLPLSTLGFFQYIAPTLQFILGVFVYREPFSAEKLQAFCLIWTALTVFIYSQRRR